MAETGSAAGGNQGPGIRLAVDIGGTFVDAIQMDRQTGRVKFRKASTTPGHPAEGVLNAVANLGTPLPQCDFFIHGTTLGLNAILERRGAVTGVVSNEGFRDIFLMGRSDVPEDHMYDFRYERPPGLVRRRHTSGVVCRLDYKGNTVQDLDEPSVLEAGRYLVEEQGVQALAICFLHSYRNPEHERRAAEILRAAYPHVTVSISTDISREYREYERTSTTVLDAYIRPIFERYIDELEGAFRDRGFLGQFLIMRSGGGGMTSAAAKEVPIHTVLSGPAGGIVGAAQVARELSRGNLISLDIGGTSLDACVIEGGAAVAVHEAKLEHYPLLIPIYDIRTIGAGGGSIAWVHEGLLKVGPRSAGAEPGPICYGRGGTEPTVTDAAVILGYIDPERFLEGEMRLDLESAARALDEKVGRPLGLSTEQAAAGVFSILLVKTVGALRQITVERGYDPRAFSMLAFGGGGPLVAPLIAREMQVKEVIVPQAPAAFSAWGMLNTDLVDDFSRTVLRILDELDMAELEDLFRTLEAAAVESLTAQGVEGSEVALLRQLELRYYGQEHTLTIEVGRQLSPQAIREAFDRQHESRYGHAMRDMIEILNVRVRGLGAFDKPAMPKLPALEGGVERALLERRSAYCFAKNGPADFGVYLRGKLAPGDVILGPAIVDEGTSTTVVFSDQVIEVDEFGHLIVRLLAGAAPGGGDEENGAEL